MPYVEMSSLSASGLLVCAALCRDDCLFLKYEDNGTGSGTCDLYNLRDEISTKLKFVNGSNLYKKVNPPADVFVGILEEKTWDEARNFCQSLGSSLAIADSTAKMDRMYNLIGKWDFWVGGKRNGTTWNWLSGAVVTPSPLVDGSGACLESWSGRLTDESCSWKNWSFCEY
ncbi:early activation antigen CD69-like [Dreissena polymorpha]|nr:early activation antigen CD69-like [Dreissena polymorpha]